MKLARRFTLLIFLVLCLVPTAQAKRHKRPRQTGAGACSQGTPYRNCPACGTAARKANSDLNVLKNRGNIATHPQQKTVAEIRDPANDSTFSSSQRLEVTGFVASVVNGGFKETCNCKRTDLRDVHINIVADASEVGDQSKYVIVEFTPRWEKNFGLDESNYDAMRQAVETQIGGKMVRFQGYMMNDFIHKAEAKNSANPSTPTCTNSANDPRPCVWRATTWEVHPVTAYMVVAGP